MSEPGITDEEQEWIDQGMPEPVAADEETDSDPCQYEDCDNLADYRVEVRSQVSGDYAITYVCSDCSTKNRVYVEENELLANEVTHGDE